MNLNTPLVEAAIEREPITVEPQTLILDAIALMNQRRVSMNSDNNDESHSACSCVLVVQDGEVLGIFTERDIVSLTAKNINLSQVKVAEVMVQPVITLNKSALEDIFAVLFLFRRYRIRHLPILNDSGKLTGLVSPESIRKVLRPDNFLKMRRVADVMTTDVLTLPVTASVLEIAQLMAEHRISCVVITQDEVKDWDSNVANPVGIVTERDIVQFQGLQIDLAEVRAQMVMSSPLFLLSPEDSLLDAHEEMQKRHVRRLVVSWDWGQGLGLITLTNMLKIFDPIEMYRVIQVLQQTVEQLEAEKIQLLEQLSVNSEQ
ncbi:putative signal-transduction protein containing cAMP-binding and CBS domains [Rivularia sp. PCC 7116]|uniref:CBS domain-containing protein n=1 Tax=Rivularia sp. PCC 7116 TaxID=373994 RepID=UPI00029EE272|nr:CBS domain-containing protein [Rivularia sp. PCC 7116]AFY55053.1 putative signal-transduction protein containing cAMP-binding and CBS domains [Rivularia sp. PCC 7116]